MAMVQSRVVVDEPAWRQAVKRLSRFTLSELAAELRCSQSAARSHLEAMMALDPPLVHADGRLGRKPIYAYIKPTDAGERFKRQRALQTAQPPEVMAAAMTAPDRHMEVRQSRLSEIPVKEIREVAREAVNCGWTYHSANGSSKARLSKGSRLVRVPSTPRNKEAAADQLRQVLFGNSARYRQREAQAS